MFDIRAFKIALRETSVNQTGHGLRVQRSSGGWGFRIRVRASQSGSGMISKVCASDSISSVARFWLLGMLFDFKCT